MTMFVCSSYLRATDVTHVTTYKYYRAVAEEVVDMRGGSVE